MLAARWLSSNAALLGADKIACLRDVRSVIRLSGPTLIHFLQGLVTNDVTPLEDKDRPPSTLYACILNAQGRYLHDLFIHRQPNDSQTALIDVDAGACEDLVRLLKRYRLRQSIDIDDVSAEVTVWAKFGKHSPSASVNAKERLAAVDYCPEDPRLPALGCRMVLPASKPPSGIEPGVLGLVGWEEYRKWRLTMGVAEGDSEIPSGEAIALEYNLDGLNGISFSKGCYVGQELMARTHFKGVVRKRVVPFRLIQGSTSVAAGDQITDPDSGKAIGSVRVVDGGAGLAHLRLKEGMAGGAQKVLQTSNGAELRAWRPEWWPEAWGREG